MGAVQREIYNERLLQLANYETITSIKNMIINFKLLEELSTKGDSVAMSILVDLKIVLGMYEKQKSILTEQQQQAIIMNLIEGYTQFEIADKFGVSQRTISGLIKQGLKQAKKQLNGGIYNVEYDE